MELCALREANPGTCAFGLSSGARSLQLCTLITSECGADTNPRTADPEPRNPAISFNLPFREELRRAPRHQGPSARKWGNHPVGDAAMEPSLDRSLPLIAPRGRVGYNVAQNRRIKPCPRVR